MFYFSFHIYFDLTHVPADLSKLNFKEMVREEKDAETSGGVGKNPEIAWDPVSEILKILHFLKIVCEILKIVCEILKIVCEILKIVCEILKIVCDILKIVCEILKIVCEILKIVCEILKTGAGYPVGLIPIF